MVFSDLFFLFAFIPAFALMYLIAGVIDKRFLTADDSVVPSFTLRNASLVIFSLLFYSWGEPVYVLLMLLCVVINYLAGLMVARARGRKVALAAGVALNLGLLGVFKYLGFFGDLLSDIGFELDVPHLALPIGISFYVFQSISYLVDVYRKEAPAQRNFFDLLLYISLFPQLIAGPIVRYGSIADEIHNRRVSAVDFADGLYRFIVGLGKKVVFANVFSEIAEQFLVNGLDDLTVWGAWIGIIAFTLQIYFDFSGYSDMAIGVGRCVGFHFCENFNHPYCCTSVTDFWRRWHMSLGSFYRDSLYIPMGGNRRHQPVNLLTVWFLTGMWHGASWNFIIWGVYYGLIVMIEKYTLFRSKRRYSSVALRAYSMLAVVIGWGIFYFTDFDQMTAFFASLTGQRGLEWTLVEESAIFDYFWLWVAGLLLCMPVHGWFDRQVVGRIEAVAVAGPFMGAVVRASVSFIILILSVALLVGATNNAFIYTRF